MNINKITHVDYMVSSFRLFNTSVYVEGKVRNDKNKMFNILYTKKLNEYIESVQSLCTCSVKHKHRQARASAHEYTYAITHKRTCFGLSRIELYTECGEAERFIQKSIVSLTLHYT